MVKFDGLAQIYQLLNNCNISFDKDVEFLIPKIIEKDWLGFLKNKNLLLAIELNTKN